MHSFIVVLAIGLKLEIGGPTKVVVNVITALPIDSISLLCNHDQIISDTIMS